MGAGSGSSWSPGAVEGVAGDVTTLGPGCRPVAPSSSASDSRVKQRRGNIRLQGWGISASHRAGVSGWKAATLRGFPTRLDKARAKPGYLGLGRSCQQLECRGIARCSGKPGIVPLSPGRELLLALWALQNFPPTCRVLRRRGALTEPLSPRIRLPRCCRGVQRGAGGPSHQEHPPARRALLRSSSRAGGRGTDPGFPEARARQATGREPPEGPGRGTGAEPSPAGSRQQAGSPSFAGPRYPTQHRQ